MERARLEHGVIRTVSARRLKKIDMSPGVPYVSVRSNDVLNGSLDLVLRLCTRVDAVWRVLRPGREVRNFLLHPLALQCCESERRGY